MARLGDAYDAAGRTDDAVAAYKRAIEIKPSFAYYNNLGGIYGRAGKIDEATAAYQKGCGAGSGRKQRRPGAISELRCTTLTSTRKRLSR